MTTADDAYRTIRQAALKDAPGALDAIRSARAYEHAAARLTREQVTRARSDGASWLDIGRALGLDGDSDYDVMVAAYDQSAGRDGIGTPRPFHFPCGTCGQRIRDNGPWSANPLDEEEGHADSCTRFAEAVRAYRAQWGDENG